VGLEIEYPVGATPLDPDDAADLLESHLATRQQLNEWEAMNIREAEEWAFSKRHTNLLSMEFMRELHKRMLGKTWGWAGEIRKKETLPVGVSPERIWGEATNLFRDVEAQLKDGAWGIDEIAARFHHRLVFIHPFPNGNGRLTRLMADILLVQNSHDRFVWGGEDLNNNGAVRTRYINALQAADAKDYRPLLTVVRAGSRLA
jgi:Fic-DOC domain mobile mystery protein B